MLVDAMGPRSILKRAQLFEQVRLFFEESERLAGLFETVSGSGKVMRERGSLGSGGAAQLNGLNGLPRTYGESCRF